MENKKLETIQEETSEVLLKSNSLSIENEETLSDGIDFLRRIKMIGKGIKEHKDDLLEPFKSALKNAQEKFKPAEKAYSEAEVMVKDKIEVYTTDLTNKEEVFSCHGKEGKISIRKLTKLVITDREKIPEKYLMQVPNEKVIEANLLTGVEIAGAKIEIKRSVASLKK